jgi:para-nitrobenzyl esterase
MNAGVARPVAAATAHGRLRGVERDGVAAFHRVPYGANALGSHRFRAPAPVRAWSGVRDAARPGGPNAPQSAAARVLPGLDLGPFLGGWEPGEEFLTANIWSPDPGAALPVMVFLHGGSFVSGSGSLPLYDGARLAARGVVPVTVNYRLGVEGFVPLPGGEANVGLRDQIAALAWVRENIAAFGGDPGRITVFGQSAGAMSIAALLGSPAARGLFHRAILQSGNTATHSLEYGAQLAAALARIAGTEPTRAHFAQLDPSELVAAQLRLSQDTGAIDLTGLEETRAVTAIAPFGLVRDGETVADSPLEAAAACPVDLLAGTNSDEINLWLEPAGILDAITEDALAPIAPRAGQSAAELITAYRQAAPGASPGHLYAAMMTDSAFRRPTLTLLDRHSAAGGRCYGYEFTEPSPARDGRLGACHLMELPYVFGNLAATGLSGAAGLTGDHPAAELSERIQSAWVGFATSGNPGWRPYTAPDRPVMRIGDTWQLAHDPMSHLRHAWRQDPHDTTTGATR